MYVSRDWKPHASHTMTKPRGEIVTITSTPRFGSFSECKKCGGELVETVAGRAAHDELAKECNG